MRKLLKFEAEWCGPCRAMAPIVKKAGEFCGIDVHSIDIDENPSMAEKYGVQSIPTIILVEQDAEVRRVVGMLTLDSLKRELALQCS